LPLWPPRDAHLFTANPDGSGLTQITHGSGGAESPDWGIHPSTNWVALEHREPRPGGRGSWRH